MRIVLTGGPGAGKTTIGSHLAAESPGRWALVPEAATQIYHQLKTRWDRLDDDGRRDLQRRIYALQLEQEQRYGREPRHLLLDRGTVDGAAYWPDGPEDYWRALGTCLDQELARYDAALWLQTSAAAGVWEAGASNAIRHEGREQAMEVDRRLRELWRGHPHLKLIPARATLREKLADVRAALDGLTGW